MEWCELWCAAPDDEDCWELVGTYTNLNSIPTDGVGLKDYTFQIRAVQVIKEFKLNIHDMWFENNK